MLMYESSSPVDMMYCNASFANEVMHIITHDTLYYTFDGDKWTKKASVPKGIGTNYFWCRGIVHNDTPYALFIKSAGKTCYTYKFTNEKWESAGSLPEGVGVTVPLIHNNQLYAFGVMNDTTEKNIGVICTYNGESWSIIASFEIPYEYMYVHSMSAYSCNGNIYILNSCLNSETNKRVSYKYSGGSFTEIENSPSTECFLFKGELYSKHSNYTTDGDFPYNDHSHVVSKLVGDKWIPMTNITIPANIQSWNFFGSEDKIYVAGCKWNERGTSIGTSTKGLYSTKGEDFPYYDTPFTKISTINDNSTLIRSTILNSALFITCDYYYDKENNKQTVSSQLMSCDGGGWNVISKPSGYDFGSSPIPVTYNNHIYFLNHSYDQETKKYCYIKYNGKEWSREFCTLPESETVLSERNATVCNNKLHVITNNKKHYCFDGLSWTYLCDFTYSSININNADSSLMFSYDGKVFLIYNSSSGNVLYMFNGSGWDITNIITGIEEEDFGATYLSNIVTINNTTFFYGMDYNANASNLSCVFVYKLENYNLTRYGVLPINQSKSRAFFRLYEMDGVPNYITSCKVYTLNTKQTDFYLQSMRSGGLSADELEFHWSTDVNADKKFNIISTDWNKLCTIINTKRLKNNKPHFSFTYVKKGDVITANIFNEVSSSLNGIASYVPSKVNAGDKCIASLFKDIEKSVNSI